MPVNEVEAALEIGRAQAQKILEFRAEARKQREEVLGASLDAAPVGVLVAEGDSWFDYPLHDVLEMLEDRHGYDVESVAHRGDPIEEMAYGSNQLEELARRLEKLLRRGVKPKAILLSGGGNDVAGSEFGMLLNHRDSSIGGWNDSVVTGVIDQRVQTAYITVLNAVTQVCSATIGEPLPIITHGYDYPVPDGRGFLGGWWILPGPWLEPGFREKGYGILAERTALAHGLIDRFNQMLMRVTSLPAFPHVHYIDLRNTLSVSPADYRDWWANEIHPTERGFDAVTTRFVQAIESL